MVDELTVHVETEAPPPAPAPAAPVAPAPTEPVAAEILPELITLVKEQADLKAELRSTTDRLFSELSTMRAQMEREPVEPEPVEAEVEVETEPVETVDVPTAAIQAPVTVDAGALGGAGTKPRGMLAKILLGK